MKSFISRIIAAIVLTAAFVSVPGPLSWGDTDPYLFSRTNQTNCAMAPNPKECERQQQAQYWSSTNAVDYLSNRNSVSYGPFGATVRYDNDLSWIYGLSYLQMLHDMFGVALKSSVGANESRANVTVGMGITEKQQIKATYEYLRQNLPFDFFSGTTNNWVFQNSIGGAYQYLLRNRIIHSLELSGHYIQANSKDLPDITFYQADDPYFNIRRIAGGKEKTVLATVNFMPFGNTALALGGGYSEVNYNTLYTNPDNSTLAYKAEIAHVPFPTVKLSAGVNNNASNTDSNVTVSKILKNFELAVTGGYSKGRGGVLDSTNVMLGVKYPAPKKYDVSKEDILAELKNWIEKPVIYSTRVLAVKDEAIIKFAIATQAIPNQTISEGQPIASVDTTNYFKFDPAMYDQVTYTFSIVSATTGQAPPDNLNLAINQNSPYDATLYSASPAPYQTADQYKVTIVAVGTRTGLKDPVTESASFILDVLPVGPQWTSKLLPVAPMGQSYPDENLENGYVTSEVSNDTFTFEIVKGPDWITLKDDKHTLTAVSGKLVPQDATLPPIELKVTNSSKDTSQKTFNLAVSQALPIWDKNANYQNWAINYDDTTSGILLNPYITAGATNLTFSFPGNAMVSGNWKIEQQGGDYYLRRTTPSTPIPDDVGTSVELKLVGHNSTSLADNQEQHAVQVVKISISQDQNLPAPVWKSTALTANAGDTTYTVSLPPLVQGSVANDNFTFQLITTSESSWVEKGADGQSLVVHGAVPPIGTGSSGIVQFKLNATSQASNRSTGDTTFNLTVNNFLPVWLDPMPVDKVSIPFDATESSSQPGILLNNLITQNTSNLRFAFSSDGQSKTSGNWVIVQQGTNYYLKRIQADLSDVDTVVPVNVFALNSTSNGGVSYKIPVKVTGDASLPAPDWSGAHPTQVTAGTVAGDYTYSINKLFNCPANDSCVIDVNLTNLSSWLETQTSPNTTVTLVNTAMVPAAGTDPSGPSQPFHVKITSVASGRSIEQDFTIPIQNVLPAWQDPATVPELMFDGSSPNTTINLSTYITSGTDKGLTFAPGDNFDSNKWQIIPLNGSFYLQRTKNASADDVGTVVTVSILALNSTSVKGTSHGVMVKIINDGSLNPPDWTGDIQDAQMGYPYPTLNLNSIVTPPVATDEISYEFVGQHPSWLDIQACTISGVATYCLVPVGNVPITAGNDFTVQLRATSKAAGKYSDKTYTKNIKQQLPEWVSNPSATLMYKDTSTEIDLNQFISGGKGNPDGQTPVFSFQLKNPQDPNWTLDGDKLVMTSQNPGATDPDMVGKTVTADVIALNNTSNTDAEKTVTITIVDNPNLPAPDLSGTPIAAQAGDAPNTYSYSLKDLVVCPSNDKCTIEADVSNIQSWISATTNGDKTDISLTNIAIVPTADTDPSGLSQPFHIKVTSEASGRTKEADFQIPINNVLPGWQDQPTQDLYFDGKSSDDHKILLNDYVTTGNSGLSFVPGTGFDSKTWTIVQEGSNYYLRRLPTASPDDIGPGIKVNVLAKNSTSQNGLEHPIIVNIIADSDLGPPQLQGDILDADMGYPYAHNEPSKALDLNTVFVAPTNSNGDTLTYTINSGPNWLDKQDCTGSNGQPSSCLVPNGDVPTTSDATFTISIHVVSKASGLSLDQQFTKNVNQYVPGWVGSPQGSIQFNSTSSGVELDSMINKNTGNPDGTQQPTLDFTVDPSSAADWQISSVNGKHYLYMTQNNPALGNLDYLNKVKQLPSPKIIAVNNTSNQSSSADIEITLLPDSSKPAPGWNASAPADTYALTQDYNIKLCQLIDSGNCSDDQYQFTLSGLQGSDIASPDQWLLNTDGQTLTAATVPTAAVDPTASAIVSFTLSAQSKSTGQISVEKQFSFKVTNILPNWNDVTPVDLKFNGTSAPGILLNNGYIQTGTDAAPLSFEHGTGFDDNLWKIVQQGSDYYLQRQSTASPDDIDNSPVAVPVLAKNGSSINGADGMVKVNIVADPDLGAPSVIDNIVDADMGYQYPTIDLNTIFAPPTNANGDTLSFSFPNGHPNWLDIKACTGAGGQPSTCLVANGYIPTSEAADFKVTISAQSKASGLSRNQEFDQKINQVTPVWIDTPSANLQFNDLNAKIPLTDMILKDHAGNPDYVQEPALRFEVASGTIGWQINPDNTLSMTQDNPAYNDPNQVGNVLTPTIIAYNNTSNQGTSQPIQVTLGPDATLPGPGWNLLSPIQATAGQAIGTYTYQLYDPSNSSNAGLYTCPGNDVCEVQVDLTNLPWLTADLSNLQAPSLKNIGLVPAGDEDPPAIGGKSLSFGLTITSKASGNSITKDFNIPILNVVPFWENPSKNPAVMYDGKGGEQIDLTQYITDGKAGLAFAEGTGFDTGKWKLTGNILERISGTPDEIGIPQSVPILATNDTSLNGASNGVPVDLVVDGNLVTNWDKTTIDDAFMGYSYGDGSKTNIINLNDMVSTPDELKDSFSFSFDDSSVTHPDWLDIDADGNLISKDGEVVPQSALPFNVAISVLSKASGQSTSFTFNNKGVDLVDVIQTLPAWTTSPSIPYAQWQMPYDDTTTGLELGQFINDGKLNLSFSFANGETTSGNWQIVDDQGTYYLRRTTAATDPLPDDINTPASLDIFAHNTTSTAAVKQSVTVTPTADTSLKPDWDTNASILDAKMGYLYGDGTDTPRVNLSQLITTKDQNGDPVNDNYTFNITSISDPDNDWLHVNGNELVSADKDGADGTAVDVPKSALAFDVTIEATSIASGQKVPFTFKNVQIIQTPVVWQNVSSSQVIFNDVNTSIPTDDQGQAVTEGLPSFIKPKTDKGITFQIDPNNTAQCTNFTSANWTLPTTNNSIYIYRAGSNDPSDVGSANIPVIAQNATSTSSVSQCVPVQVMPNSSWAAPVWLANSLPPLQGGESGRFKYSVDPNSSNPILGEFIKDVDPNSDPDNPTYNKAFTCTATVVQGKAANGSDIPFIMQADKEGNVQNLTNDPAVNGGGMPAVDDAVSLSINCTSKASGKSTGPKTFDLSVPPVMALSYSNQIKFDDISQGLKLKDMFVSGRGGIKFAYRSDSDSAGKYIPANWTIADAGDQYLRRNLIGATGSQQIDATELAQNGTALGNAYVQFDVTNNTSTPVVNSYIPVQLLPDPNLLITYTGNLNPIYLNALEPLDTKAVQCPSSDPVSKCPAINGTTITETMPTAAGGYPVVNDLVTFSDPGNQPSYINFTDPAKIQLGYPPIANFGDTNVQWSMGVNAAARGSMALIGMPPILIKTLIVVPPASIGTVGNMTMGHDRAPGGPANCANANLTSLNLRGLKTSSSYVLSRVSVNWQTSQGGPRKQVCQGTVTQVPPDPNICPNTNQPSQSLTNGATINTDANGIVSFLPSINCLDQNTYPIIDRSTDYNSTTANILLSLP